MKTDTNQKFPATSEVHACTAIWFYFASSPSPLVINVEKKLFNQKKKLEMNPKKIHHKCQSSSTAQII